MPAQKINHTHRKNVNRHSNLPIPLSTFIGRKREIEKVRQVVLANRLVTLTGAGGAGKTRLAVQAAQGLGSKFKNGVWFIDLASLSDSVFIAGRIASTVHLREQPGVSSLDLLINYLTTRQILFILDNCEHLITACADVSELLLQKCASLHILATSRELLGIFGEVTWLVHPLALPDLGKPLKHINQRKVLNLVQASESVQLFIDRAATKNPDFKITMENYAVIAEVCSRLDGMPLAIELAAAQMRSLSVQEIAQRLDQRFQLLTGGSRNAPLRQRTLTAAIDWSYTLLTVKEQVMLQRLSIFAGGATLEAAGAICVGGEIDLPDVLETITHLVDKSMVTVNKLQRGETRYRLLETIREYALEKLAVSQNKEDVQNRYLDYFVHFAEEGDRQIKGAEELIWFEQLEEENDNLRAALKWALDGENIEAGLRLSTSLVYFWFVRGHVMENVDWLEKFLEQKQNVSPALEAWALTGHAVLYRAINADNDNRSISFHEKSLHIFRELNDHTGAAWVLNLLGVIALEKNELTKAEQLLSESLALRRKLGDPWSIAQTLQNFAPLALLKDDIEKAKEYAEETVVWFERAGDGRGVARSLVDFADIARLEGDAQRAIEVLTQALPKLVPLRDRGAIAEILKGLAVASIALHKYKRGVFLFGAAEALREEIGAPHHEVEYKEYQDAVKIIQRNLTESNFDQAWAKGHASTLEQIFDYVMMEKDLPAIKPESLPEKDIWLQLSTRERDVIQLLAQGHSNPEISQKLFLSEKTVRNHISNIYRKLQVNGRGEAILLARKLTSLSDD